MFLNDDDYLNGPANVDQVEQIVDNSFEAPLPNVPNQRVVINPKNSVDEANALIALRKDLGVNATWAESTHKSFEAVAKLLEFEDVVVVALLAVSKETTDLERDGFISEVAKVNGNVEKYPLLQVNAFDIVSQQAGYKINIAKGNMRLINLVEGFNIVNEEWLNFNKPFLGMYNVFYTNSTSYGRYIDPYFSSKL